MKKQASPRKNASTAAPRKRSGNSRGTASNGRSTDSSGRASAPRSTEGLRKLFEHQLMDLYYVEKQLAKHLPKMAGAATNEDLSMAFTDHLNETEGHIERLDTVFGLIGRAAKGQKCPAMDGILDEAKDLMEEFDGDPALDAALASAAQKVEHYEITSYGSLCAFAEQLGMSEVCDELEAILDEEKATDKKLSKLAEAVLNIEADEDSEVAGPTATKATSRKTAARAEGKANEDEDEEETEEIAAGTKSRKQEYAEVN